MELDKQQELKNNFKLSRWWYSSTIYKKSRGNEKLTYHAQNTFISFRFQLSSGRMQPRGYAKRPACCF